MCLGGSLSRGHKTSAASLLASGHIPSPAKGFLEPPLSQRACMAEARGTLVPHEGRHAAPRKAVRDKMQSLVANFPTILLTHRPNMLALYSFGLVVH